MNGLLMGSKVYNVVALITIRLTRNVLHYWEKIGCFPRQYKFKKKKKLCLFFYVVMKSFIELNGSGFTTQHVMYCFFMLTHKIKFWRICNTKANNIMYFHFVWLRNFFKNKFFSVERLF